MPWKSTYTQTTAESKLGTVSSSFAYDNGIPVATHTREVNLTDQTDVDLYIAECNAELAKQQKIAEETASGHNDAVLKIEAVLNNG